MLTKTFSLEDCKYYNSNTVTSETSVAVSLPNEFEITWKGIRTGSGSMNYIKTKIGSTEKVIGCASSSGQNGIYNEATTNTAFPSTETLVTLKYENGTYTYSWGSVTLTTSSLGAMDTLSALGGLNGGYVKEIKVKPL